MGVVLYMWLCCAGFVCCAGVLAVRGVGALGVLLVMGSWQKVLLWRLDWSGCVDLRWGSSLGISAGVVVEK